MVITFEPLDIWHAYSTHDALSNGTKVNDLVTLTFALKIAFLDFVSAGGIVGVSQTHLDFFCVHFVRRTTQLYFSNVKKLHPFSLDFLRTWLPTTTDTMI